MTTHLAAAIDESQVQRYRDEGFLVVRGVFSHDQVAELDAEAQRLRQRADLIDQNNIRCRWQDDINTGECCFDCFDPVIDLSAACERAALEPRLLDVLGALYGEPACLFKDKLILKAPGMPGYQLHQDYIGWESFPTTFMTAIVAIDPADAGSGATEVFPGVHKQGYLTPKDGLYRHLGEDAVDLSSGVILDLAPGDVAIFSGYTPHRSGPNRSSHSRRLLYFSYNAESDGGARREQHYAEFRGWLQERYAEFGKTSTYFR